MGFRIDGAGSSDKKVRVNMKNGWHIVSGYHVYVEDGFIIRGIVDKGTSHERPAYVYRWTPRWKLWNRSIIITVNAFRSGVRRGTIMMK